MSTSPAIQVDPSSIDTLGVSVATTPASVSNHRQGSAYDLTTMAAASPIWFHPIGDSRLVMINSRIWSAATPAGGNPSTFSAHTEDLVPTWFLLDGPTGQRVSVPGGAAHIPMNTTTSARTVVAAQSRPLNLLFLLSAVTINSASQAVLQRFHIAPNTSVSIASEEILPVVTVSQAVVISGAPTGGSFKLSVAGFSATAPLAITSTPAAVEAALLLVDVEVMVTGTVGNYTITGINAPVVATNTFTGGSSPTITVTPNNVVFNKGLQYISPYMVAYGTDTLNNQVWMIRKPWGRVGHNTKTNVTIVKRTANDLIGSALGWEYYTGTGYSADPTQMGPLMGVTTYGPMSFALYRNQFVMTTVNRVGTTYTGQFWISRNGQTYVKQATTVALGSSADSSYLGGGIALQTQLSANPAATAMQAAGVMSGIPYVITTRTGTTNLSLATVWNILPITA